MLPQLDVCINAGDSTTAKASVNVRNETKPRDFVMAHLPSSFPGSCMRRATQKGAKIEARPGEILCHRRNFVVQNDELTSAVTTRWKDGCITCAIRFSL